MLILKRKVSESVYIIVPPSDKPTVVEVVAIEYRKYEEDGPSMRIGFNAPKEVAIHRKEILEKIASGSEPDSRMAPHPAPSQEQAAEIVRKP